MNYSTLQLITAKARALAALVRASTLDERRRILAEFTAGGEK